MYFTNKKRKPSNNSDKLQNDYENTCCSVSYLQNILYIFNFLFLLSGLSLLALGLLTLFTRYSFVSLLSTNFYQLTTYMLIACGSLIVLLFIFGCCAIFKTNVNCLALFGCLLMLVFIGEIGLGVLAYLYELMLKEELVKSLNNTMMYRYKFEQEPTLTIDELQRQLKCCGSYHYSNWENSEWMKIAINKTSSQLFEKQKIITQNEDIVIMKLKSSTLPSHSFVKIALENDKSYFVPDSCCITETINCGHRLHPSNIHFEGCISSLIIYLQGNLIIMCAFGLGFSCLQLFGLVFSCCLAKKLQRKAALLERKSKMKYATWR